MSVNIYRHSYDIYDIREPGKFIYVTRYFANDINDVVRFLSLDIGIDYKADLPDEMQKDSWLILNPEGEPEYQATLFQ